MNLNKWIEYNDLQEFLIDFDTNDRVYMQEVAMEELEPLDWILEDEEEEEYLW